MKSSAKVKSKTAAALGVEVGEGEGVGSGHVLMPPDAVPSTSVRSSKGSRAARKNASQGLQ